MKITNWGRFPVVEGTLNETDDYQQIQQLVAQNQTVIARGNGRSYGDSSLNQGNVFSTLKLNKFIEFDPVNETFTCEAGVLLADILDVIVPQGFFLPVTPGTKLITVGGAIAANVHGKNNHSEGCFGEYVTEFQLLTENAKLVHVLNYFAQKFEKQQKRTIIALAPVAGVRGRQSNFIYGSAKAGLICYLQGLRNYLYHKNVHSMTVIPGRVHGY
jgi:NAD(P)-dependent dehydrogenase (short-subunit alcohol dehydrogenase family)